MDHSQNEIAMRRVLITGASRGLGLEFVRQSLARRYQVFAACRNPTGATELKHHLKNFAKQLTLIHIDVTDETSITASLKKVQEHTDALDMLVNNAGVYDDGQNLGNLNLKNGLYAFTVNAVGPILMAQTYLPLIKNGESPVIANISSGMGSFSEIVQGDHYYYSASKTALNMLMKILASNVSNFGIKVILLNPGWVKTDMGGQDASISTTESVEGLFSIMDKLKSADSGKFFNWDGTLHDW